MNRVWTEEELDILRQDREAKVPVPVTAAKLGRPVPATYARARLIGTLVQPHQSWDDDSVARLRTLVSADPPMTDKQIAATLGRTVTQIRWKMQDLGLIGVRDLSKLAKITAAGTARPKATATSPAKPALPAKPVAATSAPRRSAEAAAVERAEPATCAAVRAPVAAAPRPEAPPVIDAAAAIAQALRALETAMAAQLKTLVAESEAGMIRAARAAIAEKARIDQRLLVRVKRAAEAAARREAEARQADEEAKRQAAEAKRAEAEAAEKRRAAEAARRAKEEQELREKARTAAPRTTVPKPAAPPKPEARKPVLPAVQGTSQAVAPRPAPQAVAPAGPKILVSEAPAAARAAVDAEATHASTSGRGGWKSVRRDPGRVLAQAKAKAKPANRADAIDLAQAAQAAIERFIAERGVTKSESSGIQAVVSRLQARGYIVVRDESGWTIDQRHRVDSESDLIAFAEARGIAMSAAA